MSKTTWDARLYNDSHDFVSKCGAAVLSLLDAKKGERILDLGCGTGTLTSEIVRSGAQVEGLDSALSMVEEAQRSYPEIQFRVADGHDFSVDEVFDAVFSNAALHWMLQPEKVIARVWQALKPGGRFVLEMGGFGNVKNLISAIEKAASQLGVNNVEAINYFPPIGEYAGLLEQRGFQVGYAELIDRFTPLEGAEGLRNWVRMFRSRVLEQIPEGRHEIFFKTMEELAEPYLYRDGHWWADYVRLRVRAVKPLQST